MPGSIPNRKEAIASSQWETFDASPDQQTGLFAAALALSFFVTPAADAACKRMGFLVNDYGKDGPTEDAKRLLDGHIASWAAKQGIKEYTVGKKTVSCELFLDVLLFDEHTCTASATVCWGSNKPKAKTAATDKKAEDKKAAEKANAKPAEPDAKTADAKPDSGKPGETATNNSASAAADSPVTTVQDTANATAAANPGTGASAQGATDSKKMVAPTETGALPAAAAAAAAARATPAKIEATPTAATAATTTTPTAAENAAKAALVAAERAAAAAERAAAAAERAAKAAEDKAAALAAASAAKDAGAASDKPADAMVAPITPTPSKAP